VDRVTRFTRFDMHVTLHVPAGSDQHKAERLIEKSEHVCLVPNSMTAEIQLTIDIVVDS
jgi:uncharacterized OsmC-like protein